jgi:hypothetical protein
MNIPILPALIVAVLVVSATLFYTRYRIERFANPAGVPQELFAATIPPVGGVAGAGGLSPADAASAASEKLLAATVPAMDTAAAEANWGQMTSEKCYRTDIGESLKKTRNYLQRTNNYAHAHPDSCSAPNHEFVGTFYNPFDGVGRTPATGLPYPPSTQCAEVKPIEI